MKNGQKLGYIFIKEIETLSVHFGSYPDEYTLPISIFYGTQIHYAITRITSSEILDKDKIHS